MRVEGIFIADIATQAYTAFNGDKYETVDYPAVINGVSSIGSYTLSNGEYSLDAVIEYVNDYGNTIMYVSLPEEYPYYIGVAVVGDGYDPNNPPKFRLTGYDANNVNTHLDETIAVGDKYVRIVIVTAILNTVSGGNSTDILYPERFYFFGSTEYSYSFHIYDMKAWAIDGITSSDFSNIVEAITSRVKAGLPLTNSTISLGILTADKVKDTDSILEDITAKMNISYVPGIVCWGSSTTAGGSWVKNLATLTGMTTYNGGVGGEGLWPILSRLGSEPMRLNQSITIPADVSAIQLGDSTGPSSSIIYVRSHQAAPLLQGDGLLNPVIIGGVEGTFAWTGSSYNDSTGIYTFTRTTAGTEVTTLSDKIVFSYGARTMRNCIQILLLGYNGGYSSTDEYVEDGETCKRIQHFRQDIDSW